MTNNAKIKIKAVVKATSARFDKYDLISKFCGRKYPWVSDYVLSDATDANTIVRSRNLTQG